MILHPASQSTTPEYQSPSRPANKNVPDHQVIYIYVITTDFPGSAYTSLALV